MNILPKKRWHVRTKDNIARVRKDEAEAARIEEEKHRKVLLAESEARINYLRKSTVTKHETTVTSNNAICDSIKGKDGHINFFGPTDDQTAAVIKDNPEYVKEKKDEKEKYEKQIGYLTYLGQDTNEALKLKSWYEISPKKRKLDIVKQVNEKDDPIRLFKLPKSIKNEKKSNHIEMKKHDNKKKVKKSIEELRAERIQREKMERTKQEALLRKFNKTEETIENVVNNPNSKTSSSTYVKQKYNNQFNPMFARQNI